MTAMARVELEFVQRYHDRHGKLRHYFRRKGSPRVRLPGMPGSPEFMAAYAAAVGSDAKRPIAPPPPRGSVSALVLAYYASDDFLNLAASTQLRRRQELDRFRDGYGSMNYQLVRQSTVADAVRAKAGKPAAQRNIRKALLALFAFALSRGWVEFNPVQGIRTPKSRSEGFPPWTEDHVALYRARWPSGTRQRLALELLLGTGQRRGDVARLGRQHAKGDTLRFRQGKTGRWLTLPIVPELAAEIALASGRLTFLETEYGKPFSVAGFGNWFRDQCEAAGVPARAHGLRKLAAIRLAEARRSAPEIASVTGHRSLSEVQRYIEAADQERMARQALSGANGEQPLSNPRSG